MATWDLFLLVASLPWVHLAGLGWLITVLVKHVAEERDENLEPVDEGRETETDHFVPMDYFAVDFAAFFAMNFLVGSVVA